MLFLQQMAEIKLEASRSQEHKEEEKIKPNLKAAIRLAQKQEQQIIIHLEQLHNKDIIKPIHYDQEKTQLQKYLDLPSTLRTKKILKSIKAELSYLPCFQVHAQTDIPKELLAIMKRDIDMFIAVISKFVYPTLYPKGSIIETVCTSRKSVKILLRGEISVFEPINYKSYKNCLKLSKSSKIRTNWLENIINNLNTNPQHFTLHENYQKQQINFNPEAIESQLKKKFKPLPYQVCRKILQHSGIITPATPHRQTVRIFQSGHLISSERKPFVVNQVKNLQHTAICLTEAYVLQLQYSIYKKAVSLLNSDEQKKYIQTILRKFEMFDYFDAKEYVKKEYMIDKKREEEELKIKQQQQLKLKQLTTSQQQLLITKTIEPILKIVVQNLDSEQSQTRSYKGKDNNDDQIDIETYQMKYYSDIYLIVSGEVTIVVDKIGQKRLSNLEFASKIRSYQSQQLLKLYSTDIFGFQQIGKIKQYNLRYRVKKNSKLLLLSQNIYVKNFTQIPGFKTFFKSLQSERNILIASIIKKLQKSLENQQLRKYQSLQSIQLREKKSISLYNRGQQKFSSPNIIKKVEFIGRNSFEVIESKLIDKMAMQKERKNNNLGFKQIIKSGNQLKDSLLFASIYKSNLPKNCEIVGNYIEIRDKDGILKRKKCIVEGNDKIKQKQKQIFRKLGIISDEDRNNHNFALISNRRSKYRIEDFEKDKKQMDRLRQISQSLPKLNQFFAKKQQILYNNIHKRDY